MIVRAAGAFLVAACTIDAGAAGSWQFAFGPGKPPAGYTAVTADTVYTATRGYGLEPGTAPGGAHPWYFSVDVPEGNYTVTVASGDDAAPATTTVKAELRRLMLENVGAAKGQSPSTSARRRSRPAAK